LEDVVVGEDMTLARELPARRIWHCDICGYEGPWTDSWWNYSSIALEETCPDDLLTVCSDECKKHLDKKLETKEFVLPELKRTPGGWEVTKPRKGY